MWPRGGTISYLCEETIWQGILKRLLREPWKSWRTSLANVNHGGIPNAVCQCVWFHCAKTKDHSLNVFLFCVLGKLFCCQIPMNCFVRKRTDKQEEVFSKCFHPKKFQPTAAGKEKNSAERQPLHIEEARAPNIFCFQVSEHYIVARPRQTEPKWRHIHWEFMSRHKAQLGFKVWCLFCWVVFASMGFHTGQQKEAEGRCYCMAEALGNTEKFPGSSYLSAS